MGRFLLFRFFPHFFHSGRALFSHLRHVRGWILHDGNLGFGFDLKNLSADIKQMNAEKMEFEHDTFDFVISWGVIHHSGNMQNILDEIYRVLKSGGKAYLMVYNKTSLRSIVFAPFWLGVVRAKLLTKSVKEIISEITDGYIARHLSEAQFSKMEKIYKIQYQLKIDFLS